MTATGARDDRDPALSRIVRMSRKMLVCRQAWVGVPCACWPPSTSMLGRRATYSVSLANLLWSTYRGCQPMNPPRISIREATADDALAIAKMHATSWQATYRGLLPDAFLENESKHGRLAYWTTRMRTPSPAGRLVVIVECDGEPAGFVCAERKPESPDGVLIDNLHVMERYQGYGLGKRLMEAAERWASELGETHLHLFVLEGNSRAMAFYERLGWRWAGIEVEEIAGLPVTARRYVREISPRGRVSL